MNILVVAATTKEIEPFLKKLRNDKKSFSSRIEIDVLITGVGLLATAAILSRQLSLKRPNLVIQAGVAGAFGKNQGLGEVFIVTKDRVADEGVMERNKFRNLFDMGLAKPNRHPFLGGWLVNNNRVLIRKLNLKHACAISVNQVSTGNMTAVFSKKYSPDIESMEGAAFHFVCLSEKIPFLQFRAISNKVGERNKKKWDLGMAIDNLNENLLLFLQGF